MNKLLPLAILAFATSASAQAPGLWPVQASAGSCSMVQTFENEEFGRHALRVGYDATRQEVTVATTHSPAEPLDSSGEVVWRIVLLDNGPLKWDEGWAARRFSYSRAGNSYRFTTGLAGENNVRQFLADLANSRSIGFLDGESVVAAYDLGDARASIEKLRQCAARSLAAN